jgi:hypothetical protein
MNVRITPRDAPHRTEIYSGVQMVQSDGEILVMLVDISRARTHRHEIAIPLSVVAAIALDDDPGSIE